MQNKKWKRIAMTLFAAFFCLSVFGCSRLENTQIVFTTGFSDDELFKVGKSVCTLPEAMIYMNTYENQYENTYGVEMWEHDFGGISLEEYIKNNIISQLSSIKAMTLLAEEYQVTLTGAEENLVKQAAKDYYQSLSDGEREWMNVTEEAVQTLFQDHLLSDHVYEVITQDVNMEISDDEARIITVQQIFLKTTRSGENGTQSYSATEKQEVYGKAYEILGELEQGREFLTLASIYNQSGQITCSFGRGEKERIYEEAAFALDKDQVSGIIETEEGFYILKCTENFDRTATEENKKAIIEKRRDEVFQQAYDELMVNTPTEFNDKLWEKVHFDDQAAEHTGKSFFEVYEQYFGEQ